MVKRLGMDIGIIGLPQSGKTTVFRALTQASPSPEATPHIGVVKVPDPRLQTLERMFKPKRTIPADVRYTDIPGSSWSAGRGGAIGGSFLAQVSRMDALIQVVRAFQDARVPHMEGSVDPRRDLVTMDLELAFADLAIIERRLERLEISLKAAKPHEREAHLPEKALLSRIRSALEDEAPIRAQGLSKEETQLIENFGFLTAKPLLVVLNIGEDQIPQAPSLEKDIRSHYPHPDTEVAALCAKLEMELAQLEEAEAAEFRTALGLASPARDRIISLSYRLLGLITFFTVVSEDVRAWTLRRGATALKAAGKIHSDMERGFILAEVIGFEELVRCGSLAEARKRGLLRLEGKHYPVQDGDIITILFSV